MKLEDYSKYYIQGSDHYLIPKDEFIELFNEMINWKNECRKLKDIHIEEFISNGLEVDGNKSTLDIVNEELTKER